MATEVDGGSGLSGVLLPDAGIAEHGVPPLPGLPFWVAHTPAKPGGPWHSLPDHTLEVAGLSEVFAAEFGAGPLGRALGMAHDLGKFSDAFQQYLFACARATESGGKAPQKGSARHKGAGARVLADVDQIGAHLAALAYGHHGGIPSPSEAANEVASELTTDEALALLRRATRVDARLEVSTGGLLDAPSLALCEEPVDFEMLLRFIYSCLTDADGMSTGRHSNPDDFEARGRQFPLEEMLRRLKVAQECIQQNADRTPVNQVRAEVYQRCLAAADLPPGVFSLTVPTGGGKTRSSLAFALAHAVRYGLRRVIYAIPYTSIIDQTAGVFRQVFGDDVPILEHHSAVEIRDEDRGAPDDRWRRLAAENWDAPLIVTTTVQLFESMFANRPSRCRKLHNIARSVVVIDEVQTLPPHLLGPLVSGIQSLVSQFGVTIVLCTATQPALDRNSQYLEGLKAPLSHIVPDPAPHFAALRRVTYVTPSEPMSWAQVVEVARGVGRPVLVVVNTRKDAMALLDELGDGPNVRHLSTLLCGRHRRQVLDEVKDRLEQERSGQHDPLILASTQVVEAGVDLDFPVAMRAMGPMDRIIQVAGRCNREGRRKRAESRVIVFRPAEGGAPRGAYQTAIGETELMLKEKSGREEPVDFDDPTFVTEYFDRLYRRLGPGVDQHGVQHQREQFHFPEVARKVRLIDSDTVPVLIASLEDYEDEASQIIEEARALGRMSRELWQRAQPLCVAVYRAQVEKRPDLVEPVLPGREDSLLIWRGGYSQMRGLEWPEARDPADLLA